MELARSRTMHLARSRTMNLARSRRRLSAGKVGAIAQGTFLDERTDNLMTVAIRGPQRPSQAIIRAPSSMSARTT